VYILNLNSAIVSYFEDFSLKTLKISEVRVITLHAAQAYTLTSSGIYRLVVNSEKFIEVLTTLGLSRST